jgi:flavin-dependent dehydrogenase
MIHPVAVLGGGPAAAAVILAILSRGIPVVWLLNRRLQGQLFGEHLNPDAIEPLAQLGLQGILDPSVHQPVSGIISYWGGADAYERDYLFSPYGMGWNLNRYRFDQSLFDVAIARGAEVIDVRRVSLVGRRQGSWILEVSTATDSSRLEIEFLVDATGRNAFLARRIGVRQTRLDRLMALFSEVTVQESDGAATDKRLMIEPMADGWWYSLMLRENKLIAVYMTDADLLPPGKQGAMQLWEQQLEMSRHTKNRPGPGVALKTFAVTSAHSQHIAVAGGDGWVAVGDACMAFDPLAVGGIVKAFRDGLLAAKVVSEALDGCRESLDTYVVDKKASYANYRNERCAYYQSEKRWPDSPFWMRRQEMV